MRSISRVGDVEKRVEFTFAANDAGLRSVATSVVSALTGIKKQSVDAAAALASQGKASMTAADAWAVQRREIDVLYASMGKIPSKNIQRELEDLEKKYLEMGAAAEQGSKLAIDSMRKIQTQARALATVDAGADRQGVIGNVSDQVVQRSAGLLKAAIGGIAAAFTLAAIKRRVLEQYELVDAMGKSAEKAGVSVQALSTMSYASSFAGVSTDMLTSSLGKLGKTMVDAELGGKKSAAVFKSLGVTITEQDGKLRASDQVLLDLAERFSKMPDGVEKTTLAMELFGKSGAELIPFLNSGKEGISELQEEAKKLGLEITDNAVAAAAEFNDNLARLQARSEGMWRHFAMELVPTLNDVVVAFFDAGESGSNFDVVSKGIAYGLKGVVTVGLATVAVLKDIGNGIAGIAVAASLLAKGELSAVKASLGLMWDDLVKNGEDFDRRMQNLWSGKKDQGPAPNRKTAPADLDPIRAASAGGAKSRVSQWDNELDQQKLAHERMNAENGTFIEFGKQRERDFWKAKLDTVKMSSEERMAVEKKYLAAVQAINKTEFEARIAQQKAAIAELDKNYAAQLEIARSIVAQMAQAYGEDSKNFADAQKAMFDIQRRYNEQRRQLEDLATADRMAQARMEVDSERELAQLKLSLGIATREQTLEQEREYQRRLYELERQALEQRLALIDPARDPVAHQQLLNQLLEQDRKYALDRQKLESQITLEKSAPGRSVVDSFESSFANGAASILTRATTLQKGLQDIFTSIGTTFVQEVVTKPLAKYAAGIVQQLLFGETAATTEAALATATASTKIAASSAASMVEGTNNAVVAGTGAAKAMAGIPFVGPALAAAAMPAMIALVMGSLGTIRSASGGFDIPAGMNPLTQLHEQEMVLPARYANVIRGMADQPSADAVSAGGMQLNVQAIDARSFQRFLGSNERGLSRVMRDMARKNMVKR